MKASIVHQTCIYKKSASHTINTSLYYIKDSMFTIVLLVCIEKHIHLYSFEFKHIHEYSFKFRISKFL